MAALGEGQRLPMVILHQIFPRLATGDHSITSKLGKLEDIEHALHDLAGTAYGSVVRIMKRRLPVDRAHEAD